jgi:hypothetical protein
MNFGGKCFLGRVVQHIITLWRWTTDVVRKSLSRSVAQGLFVDLALTLLIVLALILPCVLVLALLWHFLLAVERD